MVSYISKYSLIGKLYLRDCLTLTRRRLPTLQLREIIIKQKKSAIRRSRSVNFDIGHFPVLRVVTAIKSNSSSLLLWKEVEVDGEKSFVRLLQAYREKSKTVINSNGLTFHPLHLTVLKFSKLWRRKQISNGSTILAYSPTKFKEFNTIYIQWYQNTPPFDQNYCIPFMSVLKKHYDLFEVTVLEVCR